MKKKADISFDDQNLVDILDVKINLNKSCLLLAIPTDFSIDCLRDQFCNSQLRKSLNLFQKALIETSTPQAISIIYQALKELTVTKASLSQETDRYDEYFCVKHIRTQDLGKILLSSILRSYLEFLKCDFISSNFKKMDSIEVWVKLHWIFFSLTQGLIISILVLEKNLKSEDIAQTEINLKTASALMLASCESMKLSGVLTSIQYNDIVRNSMPPGLSGQEGQDHIYFRKISQKLKILSKSLSHSLTPSIRNGFKNYYIAAKLAYDAHIHVCTRFIGLEEPCLRQKIMLEQKNHTSKISGIEELLHLKRKIDKEINLYSKSSSRCPLEISTNISRNLKNKLIEKTSKIALMFNLPYPLSRQKSVKVIKDGYQEYVNLLVRVCEFP